MRTVIDDDMELSFDFKKISPKLCNTDVCVCYLWYISDLLQRHNYQRCHVWIFHSKIGYKWIEIR